MHEHGSCLIVQPMSGVGVEQQLRQKHLEDIHKICETEWSFLRRAARHRLRRSAAKYASLYMI